MFIDRTTIEVQAGRGGDGAVSFLREAFRPRGGPDGGDGGDGGSVILRVSTHRSTLNHLTSRRRYRAEDGKPGQGKKCTGRRGKSITLDVPPGTLVLPIGEDDEQDPAPEPLVDLTEPGEEYALAGGGRGGQGNAAFATALNQAPRVATRGTAGAQGRYRLELKLIAQVGIVGLPNAGKSTFLARVSAARPRIAAYPFTTLTPNLGVASLGGDRELILADIPGLIEGASEGKGLGDDFLRHVERTRVLLHLIDATGPECGGPEPEEAYRTIRAELTAHPADLERKPEVVALNKLDALLPEVGEERTAALAAALGVPVLPLSGVSGQGCQALLEALESRLEGLDSGA